MSATSFFDAQFRRDLHNLMTSNKVDPGRATQVIDLACHSAEEAIKRLAMVCSSAPDVGIHAAAMEIALQLASDHMAEKARQLHALGKELGASQRHGRFEVLP